LASNLKLDYLPGTWYSRYESEEPRAEGVKMRVNLKESKRLFTVRLEEPVIRDIKLLSVDLDIPISDLLAEAIRDLVRKHDRTVVAYSSMAETKKSKK
jgi:hypothetical protein